MNVHQTTLTNADELLEKLHHTQQRVFFSNRDKFKVPMKTTMPILKSILKDISVLMHCERVEIWLFNDDYTKLSLLNCYDQDIFLPTTDLTINHEDSPSYFNAMIGTRTLPVNDIMTSDATYEIRTQLNEEYHNFKSMLDASVVLSGGVGGVICCLSKTRREWSIIEKHAAASAADMIGFILDRSHQSDIEEQIYKLAFEDGLTHLLNQNGFHKKVSRELSHNSKKYKAIFYYLSIDQFSDIQGVLGFDTSEMILRKIAKRLRDYLPDNTQIARLGFDFFALYIPLVDSGVPIEEKMNKFMNTLEKPFFVDSQDIYLTFSSGISYYPEQVTNSKEGIQAAQMAHNNALKSQPRTARGTYSNIIHRSLKEHLTSEINLRKGLDNNEFQLFYQPQVRCDTGEIYGFEALLRMYHPDFGLVFPSTIIQLAESTGLINQIGMWVIHTAFLQLKEWKKSGNGHLTISINISADHFLVDDLPEYLLKCSKETGVEPSRLIIEITESVAFSCLKTVKQRISLLNGLGFQISIDDFGTGYSAYVYLQQLPVQQIKIDKQFIRDIDKDPKGRAIVRSIIELGNVLNLQTLAEGIETYEEWETIRLMSCGDLQGFYFSKPMSTDKMTPLLNNTYGGKAFFLP